MELIAKNLDVQGNHTLFEYLKVVLHIIYLFIYLIKIEFFFYEM